MEYAPVNFFKRRTKRPSMAFSKKESLYSDLRPMGAGFPNGSASLHRADLTEPSSDRCFIDTNLVAPGSLVPPWRDRNCCNIFLLTSSNLYIKTQLLISFSVHGHLELLKSPPRRLVEQVSVCGSLKTLWLLSLSTSLCVNCEEASSHSQKKTISATAKIE